MLKSGSDYKNYSEIHITEFPSDQKPDPENFTNKTLEDDAVTGTQYTYLVNDKYDVKLIKRDITKQIEPIPALVEHVNHYNDLMHEAMKQIVCKIDVPFDTTFKQVRTRETVVGNFIADLMRKHFSADCALFNSGTIRSDVIYPSGYLKIGDWNDMNPYRKDIDKVLLTGLQLIEVLEAGVSQYPALEGRFPQVSNIEFTFDPTKPAGSRVIHNTVKVAGLPIIKTMKYSMASSAYLTEGRDGYDIFKEATEMVDPESCPDLGDLIMSFFNLAEGRKYREEYQLYKQNQEIISKNFIRTYIRDKIEGNKALLGKISQIFQK